MIESTSRRIAALPSMWPSGD